MGDWKSWIWQALVVIVVVVAVLALLRVLDLRFKLQPVEFIARPFYPAPPNQRGSADDMLSA